MLRAIDGYVGQPSTHYALKLAPYVFVRPGELRAAEWSEFDFERRMEDSRRANEDEQGWHPDLIELQLAHAGRNKVRAAYNRAQRLDERRKMMKAWADYLDTLKNDGSVVLGSGLGTAA